MAENTGTTVSNDTLNSLLRSGQNSTFDQSMFNSQKVEAIANPYANLNSAQLQALQVPTVQGGKALTNTQQQARDLTQATYNLNAQAFNNQQQAIQSNQSQQIRSLSQSTKDTQSQLLGQFGQNNLASPTDSSRNFSLLTDVSTKLRGAVSDITNQSLNLLNQNTLNFGQSNLQALGQAQQMGFAERQQQFSEDITRGQELGYKFEDGVQKGTRTLAGQSFDFAERQQQFNEDIIRGQELGYKFEGGVQKGTRTLAGESFDFNKQLSIADLTGMYNNKQTIKGRLTDSQLISSRLNQALGYASFMGENPDTNGIVTGFDSAGNPFDPTKTSNTPNLQRQDFLNYQKPLLEQQIKTNQALIDAGVPLESARAQIAAFKAQTAQNIYTKSFYETQGYSSGTANALANLDNLKNVYAKDPSDANRDNLYNTAKQVYKTLGTDAGTYYELSQNGKSPTDPTKSVVAKADALKTFGYNGNSTFSSDNPSYNADMQEIKKNITNDFVNNIANSGTTDAYVNKMFFTPETGNPANDTNKAAIALRAYTDDGKGNKTFGGYNFSALDMSKMSGQDKMVLSNAIAAGEITNPDGTVTKTDNKNLDALNKVIDSYKDKGLQVTSLTPDGFYKTLKDYNVDNKMPLDGITNKDFLSIVLLGSQPGGVSSYIKDAKFVDFRNNLTSLDILTKNINDTLGYTPDPNFVNTDKLIEEIVSKSKGTSKNAEESIQVLDRSGGKIPGIFFKFNPASVPTDLLDSLKIWKTQSTNKDFADQALRGIFSNVGNAQNINKLSNNKGVYGASILDFIR